MRKQNREEEKRGEANLLWKIEPVREQIREEGKTREKSLLGTIQAVKFAGGSSVPSMTDSKREPHSGRGAGRRESQEQHGAAYEPEPESTAESNWESDSGAEWSRPDSRAELIVKLQTGRELTRTEMKLERPEH
ncbi:hypothetical protein E2320_010779 [Naja naja]|nr:hypothetical protein E2320_010779 [Naja naja]